MGKLLVILLSGPWQSENTNTVYEFTKAAVEEGHAVTVFCDADGVYNLMASQLLSDQVTPADKIAKLLEMGVQIQACRESARLRGIDVQSGLIKGVVASSLGRCAELMAENDRVMAFG